MPAARQAVETAILTQGRALTGLKPGVNDTVRAALASSHRFVLNGGLPMRISDFIAQTITQRRALVWSGVAVLTIGCIATLVISLRLDSEVFNVLPGRFSSVQGLKIYDRDFEQTRQLTFALL